MPNEEKAGRQYLRGLVLGKQGDSEGCKKALLGALKTDPGCFEALAELGRLSLLSTDENSALLRSLDFGKLGELSTVVRLLYESMLGSRKAIDVLEKDWRLAYNPDLNFERARGYWEERKIDECVEVTGR